MSCHTLCSMVVGGTLRGGSLIHTRPYQFEPFHQGRTGGSQNCSPVYRKAMTVIECLLFGGRLFGPQGQLIHTRNKSPWSFNPWGRSVRTANRFPGPQGRQKDPSLGFLQFPKMSDKRSKNESPEIGWSDLVAARFGC